MFKWNATFMVCLFIREKIDCLRELKVPSMTSGCQLITSKGRSMKKCLLDFPSAMKNWINRSPYTSFVGNINVKVIVGSMDVQKVDVVVNSTSSDLKLNSRPGLSKSLLEKAGESLQDECDEKYPNGIKVGEIAITNGHRLNCQKVFHGTFPCWYSKPIENVLPENFITFK
ncbi:hypothetical protein KUTeg_024660 [Tegillarca granosa]|uniref:Macro domain-containing protein n=1 Tax=Tegillarca granosa TaxID=220873 RepID=A0ABQ9DXW9_TEGGR|nr:hypothetical protein KUTeg_024660 [Tegillarca granosa]